MINQVELDPLRVAGDLRPAVLRISRGLRREAEELGVTAGQATLLRLIELSPGVSASELASHEGVSLPAVSKHVERLVQAGLVERSRSTADRRRVGIALTRRGQEIVLEVRERRTAWLASRLAGFSHGELERLRDALPLLERLAEPDR